MRLWYFEDFSAGQDLPGSETLVEPEDAAWFAAEFSPVRIATDGWAGERVAGEAMVPGWYVAALGMRLIFQAFVGRTAGFGAPGVEAVDWPNPVFVGDRLRLAARVSNLRPSRSRPDMGLVGFEFTVSNQHGQCVMKQSNVLLIGRRVKEDGA